MEKSTSPTITSKSPYPLVKGSTPTINLIGQGGLKKRAMNNIVAAGYTTLDEIIAAGQAEIKKVYYVTPAAVTTLWDMASPPEATAAPVLEESPPERRIIIKSDSDLPSGKRSTDIVFSRPKKEPVDLKPLEAAIKVIDAIPPHSFSKHRKKQMIQQLEIAKRNLGRRLALFEQED